MTTVKGLRKKEAKEVLSKVKKRPILMLESFGGFGKTYFRVHIQEVTGHNAFFTLILDEDCEGINDLKEKLWAFCEIYLSKEWKKERSPELETNMKKAGNGKLTDIDSNLDILQLIKEQDKKEGIKERILYIDEIFFMPSSAANAWIDYMLEHKDHFKIILTIHPNNHNNLRAYPKIRGNSTYYILKPYTLEDMQKIYSTCNIKASFGKLVDRTGGIPRFIFHVFAKEDYNEKKVVAINEKEFESASYIFDRLSDRQLSALFTIRNGIGSNKFSKEYKNEFKWLSYYGFIDLNRKDNPILSGIIKDQLGVYMDLGHRGETYNEFAHGKSDLNTLVQRLSTGDTKGK